ncbi:MAG: hypothetical protein P4L35_17925, partial [Ignavibacteriaceae bacterium]|nr:hypothetical protein [Ignavibacteriaceae bacterium]
MKNIFFLILLILSSKIFPQVENISAEDEVYPFLKMLYLKGSIKKYDDNMLPLSKGAVLSLLNEAELNKNLLSNTESKYLEQELKKISSPSGTYSILNSNSNEISLSSDTSFIFLYFAKDSSSTIFVNPIIENQFIYSFEQNSSTNLFNLGGKISGTYDNFLGFYLSVSNGVASGNRSIADLNKTILQNFTFNNTKINYFDNTEGYIRIQKGDLGIQAGRERVLMGRGINRMFLSTNPPIFDFLRFNFSFGILSINSLHGWLVQPTYSTYDSLLQATIKNKNSKFIAIDRVAIDPNNNLSFGITQTIIYANRPFELAYLNPFLFWESAQRSLNDLDNSFLAFDVRYKIKNGLELYSVINFDDIDFKTIKTEGFGSIQTRFAFQLGLNIAYPLLPQNLIFTTEYFVLRPYVYSHIGSGESLTYTNNTFELGPDFQPNSIRISNHLLWYITNRFNISCEYDNTRHGNNIYDISGNLLRNVGGNINDFFREGDSRITKILDGQLETINNYKVEFEYEFKLGFYLNLHYEYLESSLNPNENYVWCSFRFKIF